MTDEEKATAAAKDKQIADLQAQVDKLTGGQPKEPEAVDLTPYPTQTQLDELKRGGTLEEPKKGATYKTRDAKAG